MHSQALEDNVFQDAYHETSASQGEAVSRVCLRCHAPLTQVNQDFKLAEKVTWEGVTCDVCHSLVSVEVTGGSARQVLDIGAVKRGPIRDASSDAHEVQYSELHTTSLVCAGCHEYANAAGTPLMSTYEEWQHSSAATEKRTCLSCHMSRTKGNVVDPRIARVAQAEVNVHEVPGGHSLQQLHTALGVSIEPRRDGDSLQVDVRLTNKGAGHCVPTGMPGRRVILELEARDSKGHVFTQSRRYGMIFADARGDTIRRDSGYFAPEVHLLADTRLRPDERRTESFRFPIALDTAAYLSLKLHYEHAPLGSPENRTLLTFYSETRTVPAAPAGR
jgi:Cytochrome c554 and c-prime